MNGFAFFEFFAAIFIFLGIWITADLINYHRGKTQMKNVWMSYLLVIISYAFGFWMISKII